MKAELKPTYALLINSRTIKNSSDYGQFSLQIIQVENGKIRNPGSDDAFDNLEFSAQWDSRHLTDTTYAWQVSYRDVFRVELDNARRMVKTLEKVDKLRAKFPVQPNTFGQYVALVAAGLGLAGAYKESRRSVGSGTYSENDYTEFSLADAGTIIDDLIQGVRNPEQS
jgi:hypothetical protein